MIVVDDGRLTDNILNQLSRKVTCINDDVEHVVAALRKLEEQNMGDQLCDIKRDLAKCVEQVSTVIDDHESIKSSVQTSYVDLLERVDQISSEIKTMKARDLSHEISSLKAQISSDLSHEISSKVTSEVQQLKSDLSSLTSELQDMKAVVEQNSHQPPDHIQLLTTSLQGNDSCNDILTILRRLIDTYLSATERSPPLIVHRQHLTSLRRTRSSSCDSDYISHRSRSSFGDTSSDVFTEPLDSPAPLSPSASNALSSTPVQSRNEEVRRLLVNILHLLPDQLQEVS